MKKKFKIRWNEYVLPCIKRWIPNFMQQYHFTGTNLALLPPSVSTSYDWRNRPPLNQEQIRDTLLWGLGIIL